MKTVIEMAREAGLFTHKELQPELERFAELVRADERARMTDLCLCEGEEMKEQPKALRLADELEIIFGDAEASAELRRLHAANIDCVDHFNALKAERDELLEALKLMRDRFFDSEGDHGQWEVEATEAADAAIAKATGDQA